MAMLLLHLDNSVVYFHYYLHFLRCSQHSKVQQQKFCTGEKPRLSLNKKWFAQQHWIKIASLSKRCRSWATQFMRLQTSTVAFHATWSVAALRVLPKSKCFWYNVAIQPISTVSLGYPPTCSEAVICLSTLENALQNRPSWNWNFFTA